MRRSTAIIATLLVISLVTLCWLFFWRVPTSSTDAGSVAQNVRPLAEPAGTTPPHNLSQNRGLSPTSDSSGRQEREEAFARAFKTPISFWGKVVDERGNPISGASVRLGFANKPWETGSAEERTTNADGEFSLIGGQGISVSVNVSKPGYHRTDRSSGEFSFLYRDGKQPLPTAANPVVFELRTKKPADPIIHAESNVKTPRNGTPVNIDLTTAKRTSNTAGDLIVEMRTDEGAKDRRGHYPWSCRIAVPEGGLQPRSDPLQFEAPLDGYLPGEEINMPQDAPRWVSQVERNYFIRRSDGTFGRLDLRIIAGGDHFVRVTSYINPIPGSRNLEYDPTKQVVLKP